MRIENGKVVLPVAQAQQLVLGRGVVAEMQVIQLEEENRKLKAELEAIRVDLEAIQNLGSGEAAEPAATLTE